MNRTKGNKAKQVVISLTQQPSRCASVQDMEAVRREPRTATSRQRSAQLGTSVRSISLVEQTFITQLQGTILFWTLWNNTGRDCYMPHFTEKKTNTQGV